jgi:hypothetical protein
MKRGASGRAPHLRTVRWANLITLSAHRHLASLPQTISPAPSLPYKSHLEETPQVALRTPKQVLKSNVNFSVTP